MALIRHGTPRGYDVDGCRCDECTAAMSKYTQRALLLRDRGEQRLVHIGPTLALARQKARAWGVTTGAVMSAALGGVHSNYTWVVIHTYKRIDREVPPKVAQLQIGDLDPSALTERVEEARVLRDVLADRHGWTRRQIADEIGSTWSKVRLRGDRCSVGTLVALREAVGCWGCGDEPWAGGNYCESCSPAAGRVA